MLEMVSREAAVVETQAAVEYGYFPKYQCAVCFASTTKCCSQCKSVCYCSGKCQIIHWRQGHRDECHCPTDFAAKKQYGIHCNDSEIESTFKLSSDSSSVVEEEEDDSNHKPCADAKATHSAFAPFSSSSLAGVSPSGTSSESLLDDSPSSESLLDDSPSRTVLAGSNEQLGRQNSDDIATVIPRSRASIKVEEAISPSSESNLIHFVNNLSKLNKKKSTHNVEEVEFRRQFAKDSNLKSDDVCPTKAVYKKSTRDISSELLVTDASRKSNLTSLSSSSPKTVTSDGEDDLQLCENKHFTTSSHSTSGDHSSSAAEGHSVHSFNFGLPAKNSTAPSLPQTPSNGLKTSMLKVVQQFIVSKQSKSYLFGFSDKVDVKHNCKWNYAHLALIIVETGRKKEWCFTCEFECLILKAKEGESPLSPIRILSKIQKIGSSLGPEKEEDAHEFLRYAVDAMQSVCLKKARAAGPLAKETSLVGLTFGGYLHSKIKCMKCLRKSERDERMMDLTVEIDGDIGSLEEALAQFTATEILD